MKLVTNTIQTIQTKDPIKVVQKPVVTSPPLPSTIHEGVQETDYTITIFKSSEDDGFVAKIKGIQETLRGTTKAEARANAKRLINSLKENTK